MSLRRRRSASLGCITLIAVFFLAVSAFGLAYQTKPSYKIEVGSRTDEPYVSGFLTKEPAEDKRVKGWDGFDYRWSQYESKIDLPGLGSQPLTVTLRVTPNINPHPGLQVFINEKNEVPAQYLYIPAREDFYELSFPVQAKWFPDGNLHIKLITGVWRPCEVAKGNNDCRKLGILLDWVKVEPDLKAPSSTLIRPPDDIFIPLVISSVLVLLIFLSIGLPPLFALLASAGAIGGVTCWLMFDRLNLTELVSRDFVRSLFFIWVGTYIAAEWGPHIFKAIGIAVTRRETGWLAAIFLFQFVILWGVMSHPMFSSSDLGLNVHLLEATQKGQLVFPQELPKQRGFAPYPPAYYLGLLPFTNFTDQSSQAFGTLIKVAGSMLQATEIFFVFYLASLLRRFPVRVTEAQLAVHERVEREWEEGTNWAGIMGAAFYTLCKFPYYIFSQGNYSNLFGVWALLLFVCVTVGTLSYLREIHLPKNVSAREKSPRPLPELLTIAISSYSPSTLALLDPPQAPGPIYKEEQEVGPSLSQRYFSRLLQGWRSKVWPVMAVTLRYLLPLALLVLVFTAHYGTFLFTNVFMLGYIIVLGGLGGRAGRRDAIYLLCCYVSALLISYLLYYKEVASLMTSPGGAKNSASESVTVFSFVGWLWNDLVSQFGFIVIIAALAGTILRIASSGWKQTLRQITPIGAALIALTLAVVAFAGSQYFLSLENRFELYLLPLVALAAGAFLGRVWRSGWAGVLLVCAVFLFQFLEVLAFWLDRITYYFE